MKVLALSSNDGYPNLRLVVLQANNNMNPLSRNDLRSLSR